MKVNEKARHLVEILLTAFLFGTQTIVYNGLALGIMLIPLLPYLVFATQAIPYYPQAVWGDIARLLFWKPLIIGRIIALIGILILIVSSIQWLWYHHKKAELITKGIYSKIRHPQFLGIIIASLGLTIMVLTFDCRPFIVQQLAALWTFQVLGYMIIALFEERSLSKKFNDYMQYKLNVPFIFPIKTPKRLREPYFTLLLIIFLSLILLLIPYDLIWNYSIRFIPDAPFWR